VSILVCFRAVTTLFRPVGLAELALIWDAEFHEFPPRLPHQSIFYPVANADYARQVASQWNVDDEASGFAGYVTRFTVPDEFLSRFEPHVVGEATHIEYWIPAEQLTLFNRAMSDAITVEDAFFGPKFAGYSPQQFGLAGKNAVQQFVLLAKTWDYSRMDFTLEIYANSKAVYLNSWFWTQHDFVKEGMSSEEKRNTIQRLREAWEFNREFHKLQIPLPPALKKS
jgi:hypothetical protein